MIRFFAIKNCRTSKAVVLSVLLLLSALFPRVARACDVCGCGTGNYSMGMLSQVESNYVGVRYRTMSFDSHLLYAEHLRTSEYFRVAELWARYSPVASVALTASLPYQFNRQRVDGIDKEERGIGDVLLMGQYTVFTTDPTLCEVPQGEDAVLEHRVVVGAGVKLPTGRYRFDEAAEEEGVANANFQLGTGSTDVLLTGGYTVGLGDASLHAEVNYRINTVNSRNYRFGNRVVGALAMAYSVEATESWSVVPELGLYGEWSQHDTRNSSTVRETGGTLLAATVGADMYISQRMLVGAKFYAPVAQDLADGQIRTHSRFALQCALLW